MQRFDGFIDYYSASPSRRGGPPHTVAEYASAIRAIGPQRCILSSCGGQGWMPVHTSAWQEYLEAMHENGISREDAVLPGRKTGRGRHS